MTRRRYLAFAALLASCTLSSPSPSPHYLLGRPYQAGGVWWYPRATLRVDETGLAEIYPGGHPGLTEDGEAFDQSAMAAANQTLPLPCIARVTNLESGRQVMLRINDRGPATPRRLLAVTRRVAELLGFPAGGVARVRVEVMERESQEAQAALPGAPALDVAAAPIGAVEANALPPPPGVRGTSGPSVEIPTAAATTASNVPLRLPETVTQTTPQPGALWIDLGSFPTYEFANMQRATVAQLGATVASGMQGRVETFHVVIGPISTIAEADHLLDATIASGVPDGRIVVK